MTDCPYCGKTLDVRYMRPGIEKVWRYGRLVSLVGDIVEIDATQGRGRYTIAREHVEKKVTGPRGGVKWEAL